MGKRCFFVRRGGKEKHFRCIGMQTKNVPMPLVEQRKCLQMGLKCVGRAIERAFLEMLDSADGCLCVGRHILRMLCVVLTHGL